MIPKHNEIYKEILEILKDGKEYSSKEIRKEIAKVVLIDGRELARLMIEYNIGVSVENIYQVKRIDGDFFENID